VIADEPTSRLDAATTLAIGSLLAELAHGAGVTVVCATHDPLLVELGDCEVRLSTPAKLASV
jgi:ABC-type lipoprotein export system ATPase subunit